MADYLTGLTLNGYYFEKNLKRNRAFWLDIYVYVIFKCDKFPVFTLVCSNYLIIKTLENLIMK